MPAQLFVRIENTRYHAVADYIEAMHRATEDPAYDFVEGLFYTHNELYLTCCKMVPQAPRTEDIFREQIFYKMLRADATFYLSTFDYIFRYDPDWFWNLPEGGIYSLFRRLAPHALRER